MRLPILRNISVLFCILAFFGAAKAAVIESFTVRDWHLFAYTDDRTKRFSHCAMIASYRNGISLIFSIDADKNWFMGLSNPGWQLTAGKTYDFTIELDNAKSDRWYGVAASAETLRVSLPDSSKLFERFSRSNTLTVNAPGGRFRFNLTNSRIALDAVVSCTARNLSGGYTTANPFERRPKAPVPAAADEKLYAEAAVVTTNMLSAIGSTGHRLIPVETVREKFSGDHAVWVGQGAAGTLRIYPRLSSAETFVADLTAASSKECSAGKFASAKTAAGPDAIKVAVICQKDKIINYQFVVLPRAAGGYYLHAVFALAETSEAVTSAIKYGDLILANSKR